MPQHSCSEWSNPEIRYPGCAPLHEEDLLAGSRNTLIGLYWV